MTIQKIGGNLFLGKYFSYLKTPTKFLCGEASKYDEQTNIFRINQVSYWVVDQLPSRNMVKYDLNIILLRFQRK